MMYKALLNILVLTVLALPAFSTEPPPRDDVERKVDSLFIMASSGEIKYRDLVEPAKDSLVAMGAAAVPRMVGKIDIKIAREARAVRNILIEIGSPAVSQLMTRLSDEDNTIISSTCYILGKIGDESAVEAIAGVSDYDDWRIRSSAVAALGDIGSESGYETIFAALDDDDGHVRKSAVVAVGKMLNDNSIARLVGMLGDEFYGARMCASEALVKFGEKSFEILADSMASDNELLGNLGCTTLGLIGGDSAAAILAGQFSSKSPLRRALAVEGILNSNSSTACGAVELHAKNEADPLVIYYIKKVLEKHAER